MRVKNNIKQEAQDALLHGCATCFYKEDMTEAERDEASKQMARIEKLFGYKPYSWLRG